MSSPMYALSVRKGLDDHFAVLGQEITVLIILENANPFSVEVLVVDRIPPGAKIIDLVNLKRGAESWLPQ